MAEENSNPRARVLVLAFSDLARDPRVHRQIRFLAPHYSVTAAGWGDPHVPGVAFIPLAPRPKPLPMQAVSAARLLAHRYTSYYWKRSEVRDALRRLSGVSADLVVANDIDTLPLALRLARGGHVLFDAHEYAPLEFEDRLFFRVFLQGLRRWMCRTFIPLVHGMTTVCDSIAEAYRAETGVLPEVVWNAPELAPLSPQRAQDRGGRIRLVHHGAAIPSRRIETTIRMMHHLDDRFSLSLFLTGGTPEYMRRLVREAGSDRRIRFEAPVPMLELPRVLNGFDVGVFLLEPTNFNYRFALPNKLFEFVQARLAVAIGPSPEMARLVRTHDLGIVADDFEPRTMAGLLSGLTPERIDDHKRRADEAAPALSSEPGRRRFLAIVERLTGEVR